MNWDKVFHEGIKQSIDDFLDNYKHIRIYAYEAEDYDDDRSIVIGHSIGVKFLTDHADLFDLDGYHHVYDEEIYEDDNGYEHLYSMRGFGVIIRRNKLEDFHKYSQMEMLD